MLVRLRPRDEMRYVSGSRAMIATGRDGFIVGGELGLFVYATRVLSRYRYPIDGEPPRGVVPPTTERHSWFGYYIAESPGADPRLKRKITRPGGWLLCSPSNCAWCDMSEAA